jgi:hypothetical protein
MVLMGYDASVFNSVQNSNNWMKYYDNPVTNPNADVGLCLIAITE